MNYCNDETSSAWECGRSIFAGILSILTMFCCLYASYKVLKAHLAQKLFSLHLMMLTLTIIHLLLDTIEVFAKKESRIQLFSITIRCFETIIACTAYSSFVLENRNCGSRLLFWFLVFPSCVVSSLFVLIVFILACLEDTDLSCEHPLWLVMSVFQLFISLIFALVGCLATSEINKLTNYQSAFVQRQEIIVRRRDLWFLISFFVIAAIAQVAGDAWRQDLFQNGSSCRSHESHLEEVLRTFLYVMAFDLPAWGVLIVFYYLPRHSFHESDSVELPSLQLLERPDELVSFEQEEENDGINEVDGRFSRDISTMALRSFQSTE